MLIVHVHVHVRPENVDAFIEATVANALASRREPGVVRFDLHREDGTSNRFVLVEMYRSDVDPAEHKKTAHYAAWRDAVEPWMAEPRRSVKYRAVSPPADTWS